MQATFSNYLTAHSDTWRRIKKVAQMVPESNPPTGEREYFYEVWGHEAPFATVMPYTLDKEAALRDRNQRLMNGDLERAYMLHIMLGKGEPTPAEREEVPWWPSFYWNRTLLRCFRCQRSLFEDRVLSLYCSHQHCTRCSLEQTVQTWDPLTQTCVCPACQVDTRYYLFNGEQCDDDREHEDVLVFKSF